MSSTGPQPLRFEIRSCLGTGGYGEVYLARMTTSSGLKRRVALKTLRSRAALETTAVQRLRDEARVLAALEHRAILRIYDLVDLGPRLALVTEYVHGQDLAELMEQGEVLPTRVAVELVGEVAGALDAALRAPSPDTGRPLTLVHRDVKPANIRLSSGGGVKLLDFGIAHTEEVDREARTGTGLVVGTMGYLAPDRLNDSRVAPPADVYALGVVLAEALSGQRLFARLPRRVLTQMAADRAVHDAQVQERLASRLEGAPQPVADLVQRMLAYEPAERPTAAQVERECDELASTLPGSHLRRWARNRAWPDPQEHSGELVGWDITASGAISSVSAGSLGTGSLGPGSLGAGSLGAGSPAAASTSGESASSPSDPAPSGRSEEDEGEDEGATPEDAISTPQPPAEAPPWRRWLGLLGALAAVLVLAAIAMAWWTRLPELGEPVPPEPLPVVEIELAPETRPAPDRVVIGGQEVPQEPAADPDPQPVAEPPQETSTEKAGGEQPARTDGPWKLRRRELPATTPKGTVEFRGAVPLELRVGDRTYDPGRLPAGSYELWADFGQGFTRVQTLDLEEGDSLKARCSSSMANCWVETSD